MSFPSMEKNGNEWFNPRGRRVNPLKNDIPYAAVTPSTESRILSENLEIKRIYFVYL